MKKLLSLVMSAILLTALISVPRASAAEAVYGAGSVNISSGYLNVRQSASASSAAVSKLSKGQLVTLISKSGGWWRVMYSDGRYGYCHADYITALSSRAYTVSISSGYLNVRSGPSTDYAKTDSLSRGDVVIGVS